MSLVRKNASSELKANVKIIGLAGYKGTGKTTIAKALKKELNDAEIISFASPMKRTFKALLSDIYSEEYISKIDKTEVLYNDKTVRDFLQTFGTEFMRNTIGEKIWVDILFNAINSKKASYFIIDDIRFSNEEEEVLKAGGFVFFLEREGGISDGHTSERPDLLKCFTESRVKNDRIERCSKEILSKIDL